MSELYLITTITGRKQLPKYISLYDSGSVPVNYVLLGRGTAPDSISSLLLDSPEKAVCFSVVTGDVWNGLKRRLRLELGIEAPGAGIAFTVPLSSIGAGRRASCRERNGSF